MLTLIEKYMAGLTAIYNLKISNMEFIPGQLQIASDDRYAIIHQSKTRFVNGGQSPADFHIYRVFSLPVAHIVINILWMMSPSPSSNNPNEFLRRYET